jgi:hypothetical protein
MLFHPLIHEAYGDAQLQERLARAELARLARQVPRPEHRRPRQAMARRALRALAPARTARSTIALRDR